MAGVWGPLLGSQTWGKGVTGHSSSSSLAGMAHPFPNPKQTRNSTSAHCPCLWTIVSPFHASHSARLQINYTSQISPFLKHYVWALAGSIDCPKATLPLSSLAPHSAPLWSDSRPTAGVPHSAGGCPGDPGARRPSSFPGSQQVPLRACLTGVT